MNCFIRATCHHLKQLARLFAGEKGHAGNEFDWLILECGDTSPLSLDATCRVVPKRSHACALQNMHAPGKLLLYLFSLPKPERPSVFFQEIAAARAASRVIPRHDVMFGVDRTGEFEFVPDQRPHRKVQGMERAVAQNCRRNFRPQRADEFPRGDFLFWLPTAHAGGNIIQFAAITADDRLHFTVDAAIRAAGKLRAILAPRTIKMERLAHLFEIQPDHRIFKPPSPGRQ